ncbi:MAG: TonB-dependent receptor [Flavobacteriales bacterium]|nr:TonB-dependent receptor [Flavobacteriales bacterium]
MKCCLAVRLSLIAGLVWSCSFAQSDLSGTVTDKQTGDPIPLATIYIPELMKGTQCDASGHYQIRGIPNGRFKVQVSFIGYETVILDIYFDGTAVTKDISMEVAVIETHEVVVTGGYSSHQDESPVKIDQIGFRELQQSSATNLAEALSSTQGVSNLSTGPGIGKPMIRGLSGNRILLFSQGIRMENQQWGDEHGIGLNDAGVDKVEIIKGPASLLYGSDALGGVINVVDEKPAEVHTIKGDVSTRFYSATLGHQNSLGIRGSGEHFRFRVRGGYVNHADYLTGSGDRVTNSRMNERSLKTSVGLQRSNLSTDVYYTFIDDHFGLPGEIGLQNTLRTPQEPSQEVTSHITSWITTYYMNKARVKTSFGYISNRRLEFEEPHDDHDHDHEAHENDEAALDMRLNTFSWDGKLYLNPDTSKLEYIFGVQGMHQRNTNHGEELLIPDATTTDLGVLSLVKLKRAKHIVQAGIRFDSRQVDASFPGEDSTQLNTNYRSVNGSAGWSWQPNEAIVIRSNLATGFRAPNLAELTSAGVHEGTNRKEIGNPDLKSEQNVQWDINMHYHSEHFSYDIAGFYNHVNRFIYLLPTHEYDPVEKVFVYAYTQGNASLWGGELMTDLHPHPLDWLHIENGFELVLATGAGGQPLPLMPAPRISNGLRGRFKNTSHLEEPFMSVRLEHTLPQNHINTELESRSDGYSLLHATLGATIKFGNFKGYATIGVRNILNKTYVPHLSRLKAEGISNPGRNIMVGLNLPFGIRKP